MKRPFAPTALAAALVALGFGAHAQSAAQSTDTSAQKPPRVQADAPQRATRAASGDSTRATGNGATNAAALSSSERKFMEKAAAHGIAEVELGQLAAQKGASNEVKQFGQRMVQDHGKANDELRQIASAKGVELPKSPDKEHQKKMEKMRKLSGAEFDREYTRNMVKDHMNDVREFRKQASSAKDPQVKQFASKSVPTLEEHLKLAQAAEKSVAAGGKAKSAATDAGRDRVAAK